MNVLRESVNSASHALGLDLVRYVLHAPLERFEPIVQARASATPGFLFLQVGANDGDRHDPLRPIVLDHHLRGLCVEPLPDLFEKLKLNCASETQLRVEQTAVAPHSGSMTPCRFRTDAPVEGYLHGMATFDSDKPGRMARARGLERYLAEKSIPTVTRGQLLRRHAIEHVHLLQVDTEGFDHQIVRMAFDAGLHSDILHFEHIHMGNADRRQTFELQQTHAYGWVQEKVDVFAMRQPRMV